MEVEGKRAAALMRKLNACIFDLGDLKKKLESLEKDFEFELLQPSQRRKLEADRQRRRAKVHRHVLWKVEASLSANS